MELFEMIKLLYVWTWYDSDRPLMIESASG